VDVAPTLHGLALAYFTVSITRDVPLLKTIFAHHGGKITNPTFVSSPNRWQATSPFRFNLSVADCDVDSQANPAVGPRRSTGAGTAFECRMKKSRQNRSFHWE
jgi:hypothetical protein